VSQSMKLRDYILRRILLLIPVLIGVTLITFVLSNIVVDPVVGYVHNEKQLSDPNIVRAIRKKYHLDDPIYIRYLYYIWFLLQGDWGYSRSAAMPVTEALATKFAATAELTIVAMLIAIPTGIVLGIVSAVKKDKIADHVSRLIALSGVSIPVFWLALMMQYAFYYYPRTAGLPYLPNVQRVDTVIALTHDITFYTGFYLIDSLLNGDLIFFFSALEHIILPAVTLSYATMGLILRMTRSSMLEVLRQDYMMLARAKGLPEKVVLYKHALRNALIPTVTVAGLAVAGLLTGAVLTETIFAWPGLGRFAVRCIFTNDIAGIMGFTILVALVYTLSNLVVDVMYGYLDPRIRLG